jgi:hypothetical protein
MNFDSLGSRLLDASVGTNNSLGLKDKSQIVDQIRNSIEIVHSQEYSKFLASVFPSLCYVLQNIPPQFHQDRIEHVS